MSTATHRSVRLLSSAATKHSSFSDSGLLAEELVNVITQPFPKDVKCKQTLILLTLWFTVLEILILFNLPKKIEVNM